MSARMLKLSKKKLGGREMKDKILNWFGTGRVGASSKAMALHISGAQCDGSYPLDPDDLNRCLLFLKAVPEARAELPRMATLNRQWAALVARWDELESLFLSEAGEDWSLTQRGAPKTYKLMTEILYGRKSTTA